MIYWKAGDRLYFPVKLAMQGPHGCWRSMLKAILFWAVSLGTVKTESDVSIRGLVGTKEQMNFPLKSFLALIYLF